MKIKKIDPKTLQLLYYFVEKNYTISLDIIDKLDQKLANLIAVTAVVISILTYNALSGLFIIELFSIIGVILIIASLFIGILGYKPRPAYFVNAKTTWEDYYSDTYDEACEKLTSSLTDVYNSNWEPIKRKSKFIKFQLYLNKNKIFS